MSEIFAVQLTAVATVALAVLALATAVLGYAAWRKQSREGPRPSLHAAALGR
jgi:hypothetical protein